MARTQVTITYYDYETESDLLTGIDGPIPELGSVIHISGEGSLGNAWYQVVNFGYRKNLDRLEIGLHRIGAPQ